MHPVLSDTNMRYVIKKPAFAQLYCPRYGVNREMDVKRIIVLYCIVGLLTHALFYANSVHSLVHKLRIMCACSLPVQARTYVGGGAYKYYIPLFRFCYIDVLYRCLAQHIHSMMSCLECLAWFYSAPPVCC